jgi:murein DD-endopeptidase MepM/ murein hydrolase activator NlpD
MHLVLALLLVAAPAAAAPTPVWRWPVDGPRVIIEPYVQPLTPYGPGHRGIDIDCTENHNLYAPADGVVHFSGIVVDRFVLSLEHAGGVLSSYEHVWSWLVEGDVVTKGDLIADLISGHLGKGCVHIGVRVGGEYVSPLLFFGGVPRSVLLPTRLAASAASPRQTPRRARAPRSAPARRRESYRHRPR